MKTDPDVEKPRLSGWCTAAPGARTACSSCRWDLCQHDCHNHTRKDKT